MNISDNLLVKMIEKDMQQKGISESDYHIVGDFVSVNPTQIEVKSNELIYLIFFSMSTAVQNDFEIRFQSGTSAATFTAKNTIAVESPNLGFSYQSAMISTHWSNLTLKTPYPQNVNVFLRYLKVVYTI